MPDSSSLGASCTIERDPAEWDPAAWAREFYDEEIFLTEQRVLGERCWQFLGFAIDLKEDGDWFTATLAGRSVFVQRFRRQDRRFRKRLRTPVLPIAHRRSRQRPGPLRVSRLDV